MYQLGIHEARQLISTVTVMTLVAAVVFLAAMGFLVRYVDYMAARPWAFALETLVISVGASIPLFFVAWARDSSHRRAAIGVLALTLKLALFWVALELAGVNSYLFRPRGAPA